MDQYLEIEKLISSSGVSSLDNSLGLRGRQGVRLNVTKAILFRDTNRDCKKIASTHFS